VRVLVCGSRRFDNRDKLFHTLDELNASAPEFLEIVSGGARGADELAREWAVKNGVDHHIFYARWEQEGRSAGPRRNQRMIDTRPDVVIAFKPHSVGPTKGTDHMLRLALKARWKISIKEVYG